MLQSMASGLRTARMRKVGSGDQIKTERNKKEGVRHGLESNRRKLETIQGPSQGEVGSAHRRRPRRHQRAARPTRGQDSGTLRPCQGPGQKGCRRLVQVTAVTTPALLAIRRDLNLGCWSLWNVGRRECTGQLPHSWKSASDSKSTVICRPNSDPRLTQIARRPSSRRVMLIGGLCLLKSKGE